MDQKIYNMTMKEAAKFIGVTYTVMRSYVKTGMVKYYKPKGNYFFNKDDLKEFQKGNIQMHKINPAN
ncbi:helix-turn-helix domain-containing protein [Desulfococcaceae bacterium HSG9]|nr:helix-turn-helix domain-containing protein [Desulfococcaceae bacterium HSG9]